MSDQEDAEISSILEEIDQSVRGMGSYRDRPDSVNSMASDVSSRPDSVNSITSIGSNDSILSIDEVDVLDIEQDIGIVPQDVDTRPAVQADRVQANVEQDVGVDMDSSQSSIASVDSTTSMRGKPALTRTGNRGRPARRRSSSRGRGKAQGVEVLTDSSQSSNTSVDSIKSERGRPALVKTGKRGRQAKNRSSSRGRGIVQDVEVVIDFSQSSSTSADNTEPEDDRPTLITIDVPARRPMNLMSKGKGKAKKDSEATVQISNSIGSSNRSKPLDRDIISIGSKTSSSALHTGRGSTSIQNAGTKGAAGAARVSRGARAGTSGATGSDSHVFAIPRPVRDVVMVPAGNDQQLLADVQGMDLGSPDDAYGPLIDSDMEIDEPVGARIVSPRNAPVSDPVWVPDLDAQLQQFAADLTARLHKVSRPDRVVEALTKAAGSGAQTRGSGFEGSIHDVFSADFEPFFLDIDDIDRPVSSDGSNRSSHEPSPRASLFGSPTGRGAVSPAGNRRARGVVRSRSRSGRTTAAVSPAGSPGGSPADSTAGSPVGSRSGSRGTRGRGRPRRRSGRTTPRPSGGENDDDRRRRLAREARERRQRRTDEQVIADRADDAAARHGSRNAGDDQGHAADSRNTRSRRTPAEQARVRDENAGQHRDRRATETDEEGDQRRADRRTADERRRAAERAAALDAARLPRAAAALAAPARNYVPGMQVVPFTMLPMDRLCPHGCGALHFNATLMIGMKCTCCHNGRVKELQPPQQRQPPPDNLAAMVDGNFGAEPNFIEKIGKYNASFACANTVVTNDQSRQIFNRGRSGRNNWVFKMNGYIYHNFPRYLVPRLGDTAKRGQVYFMEGGGDAHIDARMRGHDDLSRTVMTELQQELAQSYPYGRALQRLREIYELHKDDTDACVGIAFKNGRDGREYSRPVHDGVAAFFSTNANGWPDIRDFVIYPSPEHQQRAGIDHINYTCATEVHPNFDALVPQWRYDIDNCRVAGIPNSVIPLRLSTGLKGRKFDSNVGGDCIVRILDLETAAHNGPHNNNFRRYRVVELSPAVIRLEPEQIGDDWVTVRKHTFPTTEFFGLHELPPVINDVGIRAHFTRVQFPLILFPNEQSINFLNSCLDPLCYPLLFAHGELGWMQHIRHLDPDVGTRTKHIMTTMMQFYGHIFALRRDPNHPPPPDSPDYVYSYLHRCGKLFQQYAVDMWLKMESNNLHYIRNNQGTFEKRRVRLQGLLEYIADQDEEMVTPGVPVLLPAQFKGSKEYYQQKYLDAMVCVRKYGTPDLFITFTCNPRHPDLVKLLDPDRTYIDRPDLTAKFFQMMHMEFQRDLKNGIVGELLSNVYAIEYQFQGLPHAHNVVWLKENSKLAVGAIDSLICAKLPDPDLDPELYEIVVSQYIHGPCSQRLCMVAGPDGVFRCKHKYPKERCEQTYVDARGFVHYARPDDGRVHHFRNAAGDITRTVTNRDVIPFCAVLARKYKMHINVEACTSSRVVKYLFKYCFKGNDKATLDFEADQIKEFLEMRSICPAEALAGFFQYETTYNSNQVNHLHIHLPGEQNVVFNSYDDDERLEHVAAAGQHTMLTAFFHLNSEGNPYREQAAGLLYQEVGECMIFDTQHRIWRPRLRRNKPTLCRIHTVHPTRSERYSLRLLLLHVRSPASFADVRTYLGVVYDTFKEAAVARGLYTDDQAWIATLEEGMNHHMPQQFRNLFVSILFHCNPADEYGLWLRFRKALAEDYHHALQPDLHVDQNWHIAYNLALADIQQMLHRNYGKTLADYHLPDNIIDLTAILTGLNGGVHMPTTVGLFNHLPVPVPGRNERVDVAAEILEYDNYLDSLNPEQRVFFNRILQTGTEPLTNTGRMYFLDAAAGTGKTYTLNTVITHTLANGLQNMATAYTGIASLLLKGGRTSHSSFKLPVPIHENCSCAVDPNSALARLLRDAEFIIIDEASMMPIAAFEAIDRLLRTIQLDPTVPDPIHKKTIPFGGQTIILSGEFRQCLPIIPGATVEEIIDNCICASFLWPMVRKFNLTTNMRARQGEGQQAFTQWLLDLGNGTLESTALNHEPGQIDIPEACNSIPYTQSIGHEVYGENFINVTDRVIVTPLNVDVDRVNAELLERFPGDKATYLSEDEAIDTDNDGNSHLWPVEYLNTVVVSGIPQHKLELKIGCTIMLLRSTDSQRGLCNGVRLRVEQMSNFLVKAKILCGPNQGTMTLLPKIKLKPSDTDRNTAGFTLQRTQFPVRLAWCMTINKVQGQTFDKVGLYLPDPVFAHGQLYVAFSRAKSLEDITVCIRDGPHQVHRDDGGITMNVVYPINWQ